MTELARRVRRCNAPLVAYDLRHWLRHVRAGTQTPEESSREPPRPRVPGPRFRTLSLSVSGRRKHQSRSRSSECFQPGFLFDSSLFMAAASRGAAPTERRLAGFLGYGVPYSATESIPQKQRPAGRRSGQGPPRRAPTPPQCRRQAGRRRVDSGQAQSRVRGAAPPTRTDPRRASNLRGRRPRRATRGEMGRRPAVVTGHPACGSPDATFCFVRPDERPPRTSESPMRLDGRSSGRGDDRFPAVGEASGAA